MDKLNFDSKRVFTDEYIDKLFKDMNVFDYVKIVNGCSPSFLPDTLADIVTGDFYIPCSRHDLAYYLGGNWRDKHAADLVFDKDMGIVVSYKGAINNIRYGLREILFYELVSFLGDSSFNHWGRKNGVARGHLPSYNKVKSKSIESFEDKYNIIFKYKNIGNHIFRWVLSDGDLNIVKDIFIHSM